MGFKKKKTKTTLCLNMIVKNESHVISQTLENIYKYIDYWVICDTGSTDGTQELIKNFFKSKNIKGELVQTEWKNFGYNRTLAFNAAYNKTDYVWVIDADDIVVGNFELPKKMNKDMYLLKYGSGFTYFRSQIFNNRLKWCYKGVLHEFPQCVDKKNITSEKIISNYNIDSRRLGDRNKNPNKYLDDANVLVKAIEEGLEPDLNSRYCFYAGQSFRDHKDYANAIKYYKKRIDYGGWLEEVYVSYKEIGLAMIKLNYDEKDITETFLKGYKTLPVRAECLYHLASYYDDKNDLINAYKICKIGIKIKYPENNLLFINADIHNWSFKFLMYAIINKLESENKHYNDSMKKEKDELYDFLMTDKFVPSNVKEKIINTNLPKSIIFHDYLFIPNKDSIGNDIGYYPNKSIHELKNIADNNPLCVAFNTYGYLKSSLSEDVNELKNKYYTNDGLYIKKNEIKRLEEEEKNKIIE